MDGDGAVPEEGTNTLLEGNEWVRVGSSELAGLDLAVLAGEITDLTGLWGGGVTWWNLATDEWVEVGKSGSAGTGRVDWGSVNVVSWKIVSYALFEMLFR